MFESKFNANEEYDRSGIYIGLNDEICEDPKYFCRSHKVFLSEEDVQEKHCMCKSPSTIDDREYAKRCKWLMPISEYESMRQANNDALHHENGRNRARKIIQDQTIIRQNSSRGKYKALVSRLLEEQKNG